MSASRLISGKKWWKKLKAKVHARDGEKCRICKGTFRLRVCHIHARRDAPEMQRDIENILLLCAICDGKYGDILTEPWVRKLWKSATIKQYV